ncbi:MAG: ABC transporter permease [Clostridiales bacterium]|nr:ABC transporter permease [Clostridiales bacterium]
MVRYLLNRIVSAVCTLLILSVFIFMIIHLTPGDPARIMLGADAPQEQVDALTEQLGLNEPLVKQYVDWLFDCLHGDLGDSYSRNGKVTTEIANSMGPTVTLSVWALLLTVIIAIPLGIFAAKKKGKMADSVVVGFSLLGISVPSFLLSLLLVILFGVQLGWLPVAGYKKISEYGLLTHLRYIILPVISLSLMQVAMLTRMTRASMIDVINNDYIKTAKSKGLKERVILYKHALRNALIPILTTIGQIFATLLSGAAVIETVFNIPGVGQLIVNSVSKRDYPVIQGIVIVISLIYVVINLGIDILYGIIDPRIRLAKKS